MKPTAAEAMARAWFDEFAACVRHRDLESGRRLFDPNCSSFGTRAERLRDLDDLVSRQWSPTWTTTRGFAAVPGTLTAQMADDGSMVVLTSQWESDGVRPDGSTFDRRGRCTIVLRKDDGSAHGFVALHTHFSLNPEADLAVGEQADSDEAGAGR